MTAAPTVSAPSSLPAEAQTAVLVGARVKALREASSLSLRDLALRSGVSAPMLSQVERGETSPTLTVAARIAAGLELRLSPLLRLDAGGAVTSHPGTGRGDRRRRRSADARARKPRDRPRPGRLGGPRLRRPALRA